MTDMGKLARALALGAAMVLAGCSGKPIDPDMIAAPDEIPPGRGLLSGDDGEFRVEL